MTNTLNERAQSGMGNLDWQHNWVLDGLAFYGEIMELATGKVWLSPQSFTEQNYADFTPPEGFIKSGIGKAAMDVAFFRRSPAAEQDGPLETMEVDGRIFTHVAVPGTIDTQFDVNKDGLLLLDVNKYHSVMFAKGRRIEILSCADGRDYIPQITEVRGIPGLSESSQRILPTGWTVRELTLQEDLFVEVPFPARVCFFTSGHSFQGPVTLNL